LTDLAGALIGNVIDQSFLGTRQYTGSRLVDLKAMSGHCPAFDMNSYRT